METRLFILVCCLLLSGVAAADDERPVCSSLTISGPPEYRPLSFAQNETLTGLGIDLAVELAQAAGLSPQVAFKGSWPRALQQHRLGSVDLLVALYRTKDREDEMLFLPSFWAERTLIYMRRDHPIVFREWTDLKAYKGLTIAADSRGEAFDAFMRDQLDMLYVHKQDLAIKMLGAGRADYLIMGEYSNISQELMGPDAAFTVHPMPVDSHKIYMALSKQSPCVSLLPQLTAALETLLAQGRPAQIYKGYATTTAE